MAEKTLMKLYANGDLKIEEDVLLEQSGVEGNYEFTRTKITVPSIIEYDINDTMPSWVSDTGRPLSIFPKGIVIKGSLLYLEDEEPIEPTDPVGPSGTLVHSQSFDSAASAGTTWRIQSGTFNFTNGKIVSTSFINDNIALHNPLYPDNASFLVEVLPGTLGGIIFRYLNFNNFLFAGFYQGNLVLMARINNQTSIAAQTPFPLEQGETYTLRVELRDTEIKVFVDNILKLTYSTNMFITSGTCGIFSWTNGAEGTQSSFDNFEIRTLP